MIVRKARAKILLWQPFKLWDRDACQMAADTLLATDEEPIEGLSWLAQQRGVTLLEKDRIGRT